jgi:branched-chain amino acid transport system permease protein
MGVSVYRYKVYAFVISAGFAGLAGCLYAYSEQYISPNTYNFELTCCSCWRSSWAGADLFGRRCSAPPSS